MKLLISLEGKLNDLSLEILLFSFAHPSNSLKGPTKSPQPCLMHCFLNFLYARTGVASLARRYQGSFKNNCLKNIFKKTKKPHF